MATITYLLLLPIMVFVYFTFCVIYNLLKTPKRYKEIFYKIRTGNVPATLVDVFSN